MPTKRGGKLPSEITQKDIEKYSSPKVVESYKRGVSSGRTGGLTQEQIRQAQEAVARDEAAKKAAQELAAKQEQQRTDQERKNQEAERRRQAYYKTIDEARAKKGLPPTGLVKQEDAQPQIVVIEEAPQRTPGPQESRTDIGQVETPDVVVRTGEPEEKPSATISEFKPESQLDVRGGYKSVGTALKQFGQSAFPKVFGYADEDVRMQEAIAAGTGGYKGEFETTREKLIKAFEGVGKFAAEEKVYNLIKDGRIVPATGEELTKGEVALKEIEQVREGRGDIEKAEEAFRRATGRSRVQRGISAGLTAADIAAGVVTTAVSPVAGAAYFGATAAFAAQELERKRKLGYGAATIAEQADVLLRGGFALSGGLSALKGIERQIVAGELQRLASSPVKFGEVIIQSGDESIGSIKAVQRSGGLTREFEITGKIIREGDGISIIPQAKGVATTRGVLGWNIEGGSKFSRIVSVQEFEAGSRALSVIDKDLIKTISRDVIRPQVSATTIYQGAFDEKAIQKAIKKQVVGGDDVIDWSGSVIGKVGEIDDVTIYGAKAGKVKGAEQAIKDKSTKQLVDAFAGAKLSDSGAIAVITKSSDDVIKSFRGSGGKTPFAPPVLEQQSQFVSAVSSATRSIKPPALPKPSPVTTKLVPSAYAFGEPLYETTLAPEVITKTVSPRFTFAAPKVEVKTRQDTKLDSLTRQDIKLDTLQKQDLDIKVKTKTKTKTRQDTKLDSVIKQDMKLDSVIKQDMKLDSVIKQDMKIDTITKQKLDTTTVPIQQIPLVRPPAFTPGFGKPKIPIEPIIPVGLKIPKSETISKPRGRFGVQVKRFGEFKNIGTFSSVEQALARGKEVTGGTLAATFRVTGVTRLPKTIKGYRTKKTDSGLEFVEKKELRLSKLGEVKEIQLYPKRKKAKKKKVKKK